VATFDPNATLMLETMSPETYNNQRIGQHPIYI